jgi:hypothetical protein
MRTLPDALVAARLDAIDASRLMTVNLISGVTDGSLDRELQ